MNCLLPKTILTFIGHYLPGYKSGGPVRTISNMLDLVGEKHNFKIITRDRDQLDNKPYDNIEVNQWNKFSNCTVFYSNKRASIRKVIKSSQFDSYYLNSILDFEFSIKIILLHRLNLIPQKQILLAPRGELLPGALSLKAFKKKIFLFVAKLLGLYKKVIWHASTKDEAKEIKIIFGETISVKIALDAPDYSLVERKIERAHTKEKGKLKILYLSSIVPKKNLKFAIEVLNKVEGNFVFDIYGPIKDKNYWGECLKAISPKIKGRVIYKGEIHNDDIDMVYPNYDLFFFPTLSENFGHVIWESLALRCPVLTTDTTPWNNLGVLGAGWNVELKDPSKIKEKIEELIDLDENKYSSFLAGCTKYVEGLNKVEILNNNISLFE